MKRYTQQLALISFVLFNSQVLAGCWLNTYWPLNDGDNKTFAYSDGELYLSVADYGYGLYKVGWETVNDSAYEMEQVDGDSLYLISAKTGWITITFDPPVLLLDEEMLMSGGTRTTRTTVRQSGVTYPATFTITVTSAGTVTVPAGTYANCLNLTAKETATVPGYGTISQAYMTAIIAPGAGLVRKLVTPNVWAGLASGTVGGVDVMNLAATNVPVPPRVSSQPKGVSVKHGSTVKLSASATPGAGLSYRWLKDDAELHDGSRVSGTGGPVLTISPALLADAGSYRLTVSNAVCSVSSASALVQVALDAPKLGISFPASSQRVSNSVVIVRGTASDTLGVSNVLVRVGAGPWVNAFTTNNWTNWTAEVSLPLGGTNLLQAWAADRDGVQSWATNKLIYVLSDRLAVQMAGRGTLSPNFSNAVLEIGRPCTMTATAVSGFAFTNWTTCAGEFLTNKPVLRFVMQSNLCVQANFVDVVKPTLAITAPTANQRWSNAVFTVKGTAKDNAGVSNVWFQVKEGAWTNASTGNNWTNWTAEVSLTPGTNVVKACAVDAAGNRSATNSVSFIYVLSDRLVVQTTGRGTLSPNYSNAVLEIGKLYSMKATGISGYAFTNWVISTNWAGSLTTNNPTLQFRMQSNLTLLANFVDVTKPTNTITAPKAGQRWSNAVFTVTGTAKDNICVAEVWYRLNTNDWARARTDNGWTNWMAEVELTPGTNMLWVYAEDCIGNRSRTNSANVVYVLSDRLVVQTTGRGTLSPNYSNAVLEIGKSYTMTATAVTGFALTNWTTCACEFLTNKQVLRFVMQSNLCLQANFVDVAKPTVVIAAPTASQRWSNALFTVKGTAKDNVGVSNVWLQLNEGAWTNVSTGNNWSNWTVGVNLTPGTNVLRAYAVDTVGNWSATNRVSFTYVLTYSLADYYYPPQPGAVWLYQGPDWSSATHTRVRMADINYSLVLPCPSAVTRQVCVLDSDYGYYSDGVFDSTENWQDYTSVSNGFAFYGFDDNAEPEHDTEPEESGRFPMTPLPTRMAVGQSVTRTGVYCDKQGRSLGTVSLRVELRGQTEVTVPAGYYPDCLHLRFTKTAGSVNKVDEEWWALGIGVIKNTRISGYSSQNNNGGYLQELISTTATKARPQALALAGDFPTAVCIGKTAVSNGQIQMRWNGPVGKLVVLESSEDLRHWKPLQTNTVPAEGIVLSVPMTNHPAQFFRVHLP